jgi:alpha-beta hydrolase superfamily lysophospholipase
VTSAFEEPAELRATWFPGRPSAPALVCLPGGSYNRHYFDLHVPGLSGYSFAEAMQRRGFTVVTIDNLGTGQSSRLTRDVELYDQAAALSLATEALPRIIDHDGPLIGVGHSMGGQRLPSFIRRRAGPSPHWPSLALRPSGSNP